MKQKKQSDSSFSNEQSEENEEAPQFVADLDKLKRQLEQLVPKPREEHQDRSDARH